MNSLLITSFIAGLLTVLAPCVLPLLPVIIGSTAGTSDRRRPFVITLSLAASIVVFTLLLKASAALIVIPQAFWTTFSGGIVLLFGFVTLFPHAWESVATRFGFTNSSHQLLARAGKKSGLFGAAFLGASLGPVFSSCSPTYFVILATVLPVSFALGVVYLLAYAAGLAVVLTAVALLGQRFTAHVRWAVSPYGWFRRGLGVLLVLVGLSIVTGFDKTVESSVLDSGFNVTKIEQTLLDPKTPSLVKNSAATMQSLPQLYLAPELAGLTGWLNSAPIPSLASLRGKVVLVDFWTYSCINCIRTLPHLAALHAKYADKGLVLLGIHAPEFQFERLPANVAKAVREFGLQYPIAQDNSFETWKAYQNRYWPAKYLIDQNGFVRYTHFGEGNYAETERAVAELLGETPSQMIASPVAPGTFAKLLLTPETHLGLARRARFEADAKVLTDNEWALAGKWDAEDERIVTAGGDAVLRLRFRARQANLVLGGAGNVRILLDGAPIAANVAGADVHAGVVKIDGERLYQLTNLSDAGTHEIELRFERAGVAAYAWTFG